MPGNTEWAAVPVLKPVKASMRPQRNAGEYLAKFLDDPARCSASMRPQRNAGEYMLYFLRGVLTQVEASMRPQRNAGEYAWP